MRIALYNLHFSVFGGGERRTARLAAHLARRHEVSLYVRAPFDLVQFGRLFDIDLSGVEIIVLRSDDHTEEIARGRPDLFVSNSHGDCPLCPAPRGIYMCMFPEGDGENLASYDVVTANSAYVAGWIRRRWDREAIVVYSTCEPIGLGWRPKSRTILNVARFFEDAPTAHHKRQDVLVQVFRRMVDAGLRGWELRLVGNIGPHAGDQAFVVDLERASIGYPIRIQTGVSFDALRDAYRRAPLYWHATGYGCDEDEAPSRLEHFGMSIVEAMSAGAPPLAFDGGGPRETIQPGLSGDLWRTPDDLADKTLRLIRNPARRTVMAVRALRRSRAFVAERFLARMDAVIDSLG